jgi:purine-binding chemotaxis protein CheW
MVNEDLKTFQHDTFAALKQLADPSRISAAALGKHLAQVGAAPSPVEGGSAQPPAALVEAAEQYLVFSLADCEMAVKAELVQGVERLGEITFVPNIAPWVRGVMNLRGSIVSVVDLRLFLDREGIPATGRTRLLSLQWKEMIICLIADAVHEMLPIPAHAITEGAVQEGIPPWIAPYAFGAARLANNRSLVLINVPQLLFSEKMHHYTL